jgi:hypothetical protein
MAGFMRQASGFRVDVAARRVVALAGVLALVALAACGSSPADKSSPPHPAAAGGTGEVYGTVRHKAGGAPVDDATLVLSIGDRTYAAITAGGGRYAVSDLAPGEYRAVAYLAESSAARTKVMVAAGKRTRVDIAIDTAREAHDLDASPAVPE